MESLEFWGGTSRNDSRNLSKMIICFRVREGRGTRQTMSRSCGTVTTRTSLRPFRWRRRRRRARRAGRGAGRSTGRPRKTGRKYMEWREYVIFKYTLLSTLHSGWISQYRWSKKFSRYNFVEIFLFFYDIFIFLSVLIKIYIL